jgi:hypothetical protein
LRRVGAEPSALIPGDSSYLSVLLPKAKLGPRRPQAGETALLRAAAPIFWGNCLPLDLSRASLVFALGDLFHDFPREGFEITGVAGAHDPLVGHDLDILPFGSGIDHVRLDRLVRVARRPLRMLVSIKSQGA